MSVAHTMALGLSISIFLIMSYIFIHYIFNKIYTDRLNTFKYWRSEPNNPFKFTIVEILGHKDGYVSYKYLYIDNRKMTHPQENSMAISTFMSIHGPYNYHDHDWPTHGPHEDMRRN